MLEFMTCYPFLISTLQNGKKIFTNDVIVYFFNATFYDFWLWILFGFTELYGYYCLWWILRGGIGDEVFL